jgi:hypothetical protein
MYVILIILTNQVYSLVVKTTAYYSVDAGLIRVPRAQASPSNR